MLKRPSDTASSARPRSPAIPLPPTETYEPGVDLTVQGRSAAQVYLVLNGVVKLAHVAADGRESIVDLASGGDIIGLHSALLGEECFGTATTLTRCELARWSTAEFLRRLNADAAFSAELCRLALRRGARLRYRVIEIGSRTARERLETVLKFWLAAEGDSLGEFNLRMSRSELAQFLLISECQVSRLWSELERDRVVTRRGRRIRVLHSELSMAALSHG